MKIERIAAAASCTVGLFFAAALVAHPAIADELSPPLAKGEVVSLIVDKKVSFIRKRDGAKQAYDFKGDGTVYFTTSTSMRNIPISGAYTLGDDGVVCFKWNTDKYMTMQDGCILFRRDGDKLVLVGERNPNAVFGEVVQ